MDVAVDIREGSPSYGDHVAVILNSRHKNVLLRSIVITGQITIEGFIMSIHISIWFGCFVLMN